MVGLQPWARKGGGLLSIGSHNLNDNPLIVLEVGESYRFADWPNPQLKAEPGVYTIWDGDDLIYAGYSGRDNTKSGLLGRLRSHRSGRRSGNQFCVYLFDRIILPQLTPEEIRQIAAAELWVDDRIKRYVAERLKYRFRPCQSQAEAETLEIRVLNGEMAGRIPLLNSTRRRRSAAVPRSKKERIT
jgi:hypothetical protein